MKAIFILMDTLNRRFLPAYGNTWVKTPAIDRFAQLSIRFDNHWIGSAPCMPARRDMLTGRLNFLEKPWGSVEPYDVLFPHVLREAGIYSHLETDHYHYFHPGGENYHTCFNGWNLYRGQEGDLHVSMVNGLPEPEHLGVWHEQYAKNRTEFKTDADFSSPKTFQGAIDWLKLNEGTDNYLLWVEAFDPHEPYDTPDEFLELYNDDWDGPLFNWNRYEQINLLEEAVEHLRRRYAATLSMNDKWFGKLLEEIERQGGFKDTLIILTSDHGHMLGEHGITGKGFSHAWNEMAHIPLFVHLPGSAHAGESRTQLTQNIDLMPTLMEYFAVEYSNPIHGHSWMDILYDNAPAKRDAALFGWFGMPVNVTDGCYTYFRAAVHEDNQPLYRYFLTPTRFARYNLPGKEFYTEAEFGHYLPWTDFPVIRAREDMRRTQLVSETKLYNIKEDYAQEQNLAGTEIERKYEAMLIEAMKEHDAPEEQYERLGLSVEENVS
jgi:arylsulfatase A-like enzyme